MTRQIILFVAVMNVVAAIGCSGANGWDDRLRADSTAVAESLSKTLTPWDVPDRICPVENHGAKADGLTVNTSAIQETIDECSSSGGGVVLFSGGDYVTGTIVLRSKVMLEVAPKARILGSTDLSDYPEHRESLKSLLSEEYKIRRSLIYAENVTDIGIRGKGEIYFRGERQNFPGEESTGEMVGRPVGIRIIQCSHVVMQDITLRNSAAWMQNYVASRDLIFDGIKVTNHANYNNDGLDIDSCQNVIVRNAFINAEDDAMCLKGAAGSTSKNILIENSTFYSSCNALKIGTETQGSFSNIVAHDLILGGIPDDMEALRGHEGISGITLATVDGGDVGDISITKVMINKVECPIFIRLGDRGKRIEGASKPSPGHIQRVLIENVTGNDNGRQGSFISGIADSLVEDVAIRDVDLSMAGGGTTAMTDSPVSEDRAAYPDAKMFSAAGLPAYGFFLKHARDIVLDNVKVVRATSDARQLVSLGDDINNVTVNGERIR